MNVPKEKLLVILTFGINTVFGQGLTIPDELYGFRLGQYKTAVINELGQPSKTQMLEDSTTVDFYFLSSDSSTCVVFQYSPRKPKEIFAIQLSGTKTDRLYYGIQLGDSEEKTISVFGKPDTIMNQEFNNNKEKLLKYTERNLSFLFNDNKVESIRIWDQEQKKHYNNPSVKELLNIIATNDKQSICDILSPNLEIYFCDRIVTWKNSFYKDVYLEKTSAYEFIINSQYGLKSLKNETETYPYYNIRFIADVGTFPVFKFPKETLISEIVLNFQQGRYKIYEIKYRCDKN